jgi:hypothetical protein
MRIAITTKVQPIELEIDENTVITYKIKEMTGKDRDDYFTESAAKTKLDKDGNPTEFKDFSGLYSTLLSRCVYDAAGKRVSAEEIDTWSASAQAALFAIAQELNGMKAKPAEDEKKS